MFLFRLQQTRIVLAITMFVWGAAAQSTAFTHQAKLSDNTLPANGTYEMGFTLHDAHRPPGRPA